MLRPGLDDADKEFLQLLASKGEAKIDDLCDETHVTATAVRQRLTRLQDMGLVARVVVRAGRGRPYHRYAVTGAGQRALGDNYAELAALLWQSLSQIEDVAIRQGVIDRVRDQFAQRYGGVLRYGTLDQKLVDLQRTLRERGYRAEVAVDDAGQSVLREHHCPYFDLASSDRGICDLERDVYQQLLGVELELVQNCCDGGSCCEFRPVAVPSGAVAEAGHSGG